MSDRASLLHLNRGPGPVIERKRESIGERWCFGCRKRREYFFVVRDYDAEINYYDPWPAYECAHCHEDRMLFPGYKRTWEA